jgi:hypothetical protein
MVEVGAAGFVVKEEAPETVVEAVRAAARGEVFFSGEQRARARHWHEEVGERWESLTEREREVLRLLGVVRNGKDGRVSRNKHPEQTGSCLATGSGGMGARPLAGRPVEIHRIKTVVFHDDKPPKVW